MNINYISFANKKWDIGCSKRQLQICKKINDRFNFFNEYHVYNETALKDDYYKYFKNYLTDRGYAQWSWKSYLILNEFKRMNDNDILIYHDCGCDLQEDLYEKYIQKIKYYIDKIYLNSEYICLTNAHCPNIWIVNKDILNKFNLINDNYFLYKYPHWQAGLLLIKKCEQSIKLISDWFDFQKDNYLECIHKRFEDTSCGLKGYKHNGSDQAILQCLLYKNNINVVDMTDILKFKIVRRKRT